MVISVRPTFSTTFLRLDRQCQMLAFGLTKVFLSGLGYGYVTSVNFGK